MADTLRNIGGGGGEILTCMPLVSVAFHECDVTGCLGQTVPLPSPSLSAPAVNSDIKDVRLDLSKQCIKAGLHYQSFCDHSRNFVAEV